MAGSTRASDVDKKTPEEVAEAFLKSNGSSSAEKARPSRRPTSGVRSATCASRTVPADVVACAQRCVLDLAGVAAAGSHCVLRARMRPRGCAHGRAAGARRGICSTDSRASLPGAAFAGAAAIDALDAHDGHVLTKGHSGVVVLPAILAFTDNPACTGREFLTCVVLGYEVATRAGIALHATVPDFSQLRGMECDRLRCDRRAIA
jgi:hypothetical protein